MAKTEEAPVSDAVDSTTTDIAMADAGPIEAPKEIPSETPDLKLSENIVPVSDVPEQPIEEPIVVVNALITDAEALPPTSVVPVPSEVEDVPMAEPGTVEETQASGKEETKAPTEDEPKEDTLVVMEEETSEELTEQIKKTDSDAGDEPKIVDVDVDSMDVDAADVASSVVNGSVVADPVEVPNESDKELGAVVELAVEATEDVATEKKIVKSDEAHEELKLESVEEYIKPIENEVKTVVDDLPMAVDAITEKVLDPEVVLDVKAIEQTENVVDEVIAEKVVAVEPSSTEKTEMEVTENLIESSTQANDNVDAEIVETHPVKTSEVEIPITADSQTDPSSEVKITNGTSSATRTDEVTIPVIVEQSDASPVTHSTTSPQAILSTSSETNELTETTASKTSAGKEKVSRVEITIEQVEKLPGQSTQTTTTTHIVKEIIIKEQQHVSPTKSVDIAEPTIETTAVPQTEQLNGQTNGNAADHISKINGKELDAEDEKNGDDSDKENEVSTTNGSGTAAAIAESEHLADVVLKKCAATTVASADSIKPNETIPDVTV